mmetsp:Transcript_62753/g.149865  ORF Transcript_62753/g.149865 Transcript_62753/m.149865 type:complete len:879 (-) Transcript_62753:114-2750(-)
MAENFEVSPRPPQGVDAEWPLDGQPTARFAEQVVAALANKGYCVIQTNMSDDAREAAWKSAQEQDRDFFRMKQEVETGYMGFDSNNKIAWLQERREEQSNPDGLKYPEDEELNNAAFDASQLLFRDLATSIGPMAVSIGVTFSYIMNPLLRMSMTKNEEEDYLPESVRDMMQDPGSGWSAPLQEYIFFARRRRLGLLHLIENQGGEIWFYPREQNFLPGAQRSMRISCTQNTLLIFRHDVMDYSYQPAGRSLALQAWLMQDTGKSQAVKEIQVNLGQMGELGEVVCNPGPEVPDGPKASIMALTTRLPGEAWSPSQYWAMFASGTDTCSQWPYMRWETEPYYEEGADSIATGKSYPCHGGFVSHDQITQFDNVFFGIDETEARAMIPGQKMSMEVGYECLVASGFNKKSLKGRRMGLWFGDVGPDWHSFQMEWARFCPDICPTTMGLAMSCATTAARIAHTFDIRGPVSSYDTACSASLVAMNAAHLMMFDSEIPRPDNAEALVVGVNTLLGPGSFIGNCMATMLSHQGRSFTFNRSADGYQRGEGCGAVFVKMYQGDKQDEEDRVCALIGTATNQDGRSASLTAPNGPAQQQVIKKSMRFAGINPNTVSIAECHGTGTALGDPIEVGALMAVMHERKVPIFKTSAKSNIAHLEAGAGIAGLTKCIMMINMGTAPPNCHFNIINPHLTIEGYPVYFDTEDIDIGLSSLYCGVSSFGFGGTNSRADVFGYATKGHKAAVKANLPPPSVPRALHMGQTLYISGSWDDFTSYKPMEGGRYGTYITTITVGEACCEEFQLSCSKDHLEVIHPLVPRADFSEQVVGPDYVGRGKTFLIDGSRDGVSPGTRYKIEFNWMDDRKTISWSVAPEEEQVAEDGEFAD